MPLEIERKFRVTGDQWRAAGKPVRIRQGYLSLDPERTVRVRIAGERATLTIKGYPWGIARPEFEYSIPLEEAEEMLQNLCLKPIIEKDRREIGHAGRLWVVDEFYGENEGLILAEIELLNENDNPEIPGWVGAEVTGNPRYFNANLVHHPYRLWQI